jgi:nucleotide-binding universal stress UspA family protein
VYATVLFPVDLHESTTRLESVLTFLNRLGTERVLLTHVVTGEVEHARRARKRLNQVSELVSGHGFVCETLVRRGSTATTVVEAARAAQADLIVVPWKRKGWLQRTIVGSVTTDIVRLSELPVLVHKALRQQNLDAATRADRAASSARLRGVLYATDFQATDSSVAPHVQACGRLATTLHVLNVRDRAPDPHAEEKREREVRANLDRLARECGTEYDAVEQHAVLGTARKVVPKYAGRGEIELVILGRADAKAPLSGIMGSTAEELAHATRCSLLIVPRHPAGETPEPAGEAQ